MRTTLFYIPSEILGLPVFGFGLLLAAWVVGSVLLVAWLVRRQGWNADTRSYLPVLLLVGLAIAYLLPAISDSHGLPIRGYGTMLLVALVSSVGMGAYRARRMGLDPELILSLAFWLIVAGIIGARLFYVVEYWDVHFADKPLGQQVLSTLAINTGGLVVYGAMVVGGAAFVAFVYRHKLPGFALADLIAPSVALGVGLGRIGCFMNGCCFGGPCDLPWAVTFPADSPPHEQQIHLGLVYGMLVGADAEHRPVVAQVEADSPAAAAGLVAGDPIERMNGHEVQTLADAQRELGQAFAAGGPLELTTPHGVAHLAPIAGTLEHSRPVHPTQLYSAIDAVLLCLFLLAYYPYRRRDGELTAITLTVHPISRFLLEIIRTDEGPIFGTGLSISQNISLVIFVGAVILWFRLARQPRGTAWPAKVAG
ncbi:MAG: prolipoprotein diacylglyceryl transferase [Planctomycetia bacterium]|nr:prolipoprotein diacylglyceryl transferase [Planctomycetia bacterium]